MSDNDLDDFDDENFEDDDDAKKWMKRKRKLRA